MAEKKIKCLVWDLDNTLWDGTLLEGDTLTLKPGVRELLETLDERGILLSIASRNHEQDALDRLQDFGLAPLFLVPQISWGDKSASIRRIAEALNLGLDSFAYIDDSDFERAEVAAALPEVLVLEDTQYLSLLSDARFVPRFITDDSRRRREMYREDLSRRVAEQDFSGDNADFLSTLDMHLRIAPVTEQDLMRAEELTVRTHQLNSTGVTYSYEQLRDFIGSDRHVFVIVSLKDRFGDYGKIGLALAEKLPNGLHLRLLLMSCRVMTRGVGTAVLTHFVRLCAAEGCPLYADFISTERNRIMYITYKLAGFVELEEEDDEGRVLFVNDCREAPPYPPYFHVEQDAISEKPQQAE